jgi:hypothetical protein
MWTRRLHPGLIPVAAAGIVALLALNVSLAAQIPIGPSVTITPPQPMAAIEFVQESGIERWRVKLTRGHRRCVLRISGSSARRWVKSTRA